MEKENGDPNDPNFGWDGTHSGQLLNPGVFVYTAEIEYKDGVEEVVTGDVTVIK